MASRSAGAPTIGTWHVKFSHTYVVTAPKAARSFSKGNHGADSLAAFHATT